MTPSQWFCSREVRKLYQEVYCHVSQTGLVLATKAPIQTCCLCFWGLGTYWFRFLSQVGQDESRNYTKATHVNVACHSLSHNFRKTEEQIFFPPPATGVAIWALSRAHWPVGPGPRAQFIMWKNQGSQETRGVTRGTDMACLVAESG